jgi:adenylate cyclase
VTSPESTGSSPAQPKPEECKDALERILASRVFEQAGRASEFLRFVVEETLAGRGDRLKGYTIAVEVFDKPETFDAQSDPLVRVEAGRLRRRLMEYYQGDGRSERVRIELSRGGYAPSFWYAAAPAAEKRVAGRRRRRLAWRLFAAAMIAVATLLAWNVVNRGLAPAGTAAAPTPALRGGLEPRVLVLPFANLSGDGDLDSFAAGIVEEIILTLVAFHDVATASPGADVEAAALSDLRARYGARYVLVGSVRTEGARARVSTRLVDSELGTQLWTATFDEDLGATSRLAAQERIARRIGATLSSPNGPVYVNEAALHADKAADTLDRYQCLLRFYDYLRTFDAVTHADSVRCMERVVATEPKLAEAWSALAALYLHERTFGYGGKANRDTAIERALEAARKSLDITGSDRIAAVTIASIRLSTGDREGFERGTRRALEIKPVRPGVAGRIGFLCVVAGDWERGLPLMEEAILETTFVPGWYYSAYAFRYLLTHEYAQALDWAVKIDAPTWFAAPMTIAAAAALAGSTDTAQREAARLLELDPAFPTTGRARLRSWGLDEELQATLLEGLRLAGLSVQ